MGGQNQARSMPQSVFDGGQGFADSGIVHDAAIVEGDVEIHAHENTMVVERQIANGEFGHDFKTFRECIPVQMSTQHSALSIQPH